jgi:hypothetical protein
MKKNLNDMKVLAQANNGILLSTVYVNVKTKLLWKCSANHEFSASPNSVQSGHWCPDCSKLKAGDSQRLGIELFKRLAIERGGECLSLEYKSIKAALKWRCSFGHEWESKAEIIKRGSWCPICGGSTFEELVRSILETSLKKKFPKTRPSWLLNSRQNQMELDGFCEDLSLGFEYQGVQHYKENTYFNKKSKLPQRIEDDLLKQKLCKENDVTLLVIPYTIPASELPAYIQNECSRLGLGIGTKFAWNDRDIYGRKVRELNLLRQLAEQRNGKLLSNIFHTSTTPMLWRCDKLHVWEAAPSVIKTGVWCPTCGRDNARIAITTDLEIFQKLAEKHGGVCLTTERPKANYKLHFRCAMGHEWAANQHSIKKGHWCPKCSRSGTGAKYSVDDVKTLAAEKGGECLSAAYEGAHSSLQWKCCDGHLFKATLGKAKLSWCPKCDKSKKFLEICIDRAKKNGGKLLSTRFLDSKEKMEWQCSSGHVWFTSWTSVSSGRWCPVCGRINQWKTRKGSLRNEP